MNFGTNFVCTAARTPAFAKHVFFLGEVTKVILPDPFAQTPAPILWLNGKRSSVMPQSIL